VRNLRDSAKPKLKRSWHYCGGVPPTPEDVAKGLGIHVAEALKLLESLVKVRRVATVIAGGKTFYRAAGPTESPPP